MLKKEKVSFIFALWFSMWLSLVIMISMSWSLVLCEIVELDLVGIGVVSDAAVDDAVQEDEVLGLVA